MSDRTGISLRSIKADDSIKQGKAAALSCPRYLNHFYSSIGAADAWNMGGEEYPVLPKIEMPPTVLPHIVGAILCVWFRTERGCDAIFEVYMDVHLARFLVEAHTANLPRGLQAKTRSEVERDVICCMSVFYIPICNIQ